MSALHQLRAALELRFPDAMPIARGLAPALGTGIPALDAALPGRGLPRGCLTIWRGGAGASALLRGACAETVGRGERAAWVDGAGTTLGDFWPRGVMMVRWGRGRGGEELGVGERGSLGRARGRGRRVDGFPDTSLNTRGVVFKALAAAEELLRSGGFALVVVTGVPAGVDAELVRLSRVAREGGAALVVVEHAGTEPVRASAVAAARLKVESWYRPEAHVWRRGVFGEPVEVETMGIGARVTGTGWLKHVNLQLPVLHHAYRLSLDPGLVDRRGVQPADLRRYERAREQLAHDAGGFAVESSRPADESSALSVEAGVQEVVEQAVQPEREHVESAGGAGLAGAGEAGGGATRGGAAAADRGVRPGLGGRAWTGRAPLRRAAARTAG